MLTWPASEGGISSLFTENFMMAMAISDEFELLVLTMISDSPLKDWFAYVPPRTYVS